MASNLCPICIECARWQKHYTALHPQPSSAGSQDNTRRLWRPPRLCARARRKVTSIDERGPHEPAAPADEAAVEPCLGPNGQAGAPRAALTLPQLLDLLSQITEHLQGAAADGAGPHASPVDLPAGRLAMLGDLVQALHAATHGGQADTPSSPTTLGPALALALQPLAARAAEVGPAAAAAGREHGAGWRGALRGTGSDEDRSLVRGARSSKHPKH